MLTAITSVVIEILHGGLYNDGLYIEEV